MLDKLKKLDEKYILSTYKKSYVNFKQGINGTLFDDKKKDYVDFTSGIGVVSVGHGNKKIANKICEQANNIIHASNRYLIEPQVKLAQKMAQLIGYDVATFFANSGAEANETAIKIARKYGEINFNKKKYKIITLEHSFHGRTITTIKATGQKKFHSQYFSPYPNGFSYNSNIKDIYNSIDDETIAVMIELVQGEGGVSPLDKKEVQALSKFLKENNILLIIDEVQTGIYRTGEFLASSLYEIKPDIITMAKGLGGGVPIAAVATKHKDILSPGDHGSTFGGNYLSTSVALEVVNILEMYKNEGKLDETIIYFEKKLKEIYKKYQDFFLGYVGLGLMRGIRVKNEEILEQIVSNSFLNGLLLLKAGKNTLRFLPVLTISKEEIDKGFQRLDEVLNKIF